MFPHRTGRYALEVVRMEQSESRGGQAGPLALSVSSCDCPVFERSIRVTEIPWPSLLFSPRAHIAPYEVTRGASRSAAVRCRPFPRVAAHCEISKFRPTA